MFMMDHLDFPIDLTHMFLDCGSKPRTRREPTPVTMNECLWWQRQKDFDSQLFFIFIFLIEVALECQEKKKIEIKLNHINPLSFLELQ